MSAGLIYFIRLSVNILPNLIDAVGEHHSEGLVMVAQKDQRHWALSPTTSVHSIIEVQHHFTFYLCPNGLIKRLKGQDGL